MIEQSKIENPKSKIGRRFRPTYWRGRIRCSNNCGFWIADFGIKRKCGLLDSQSSAKGAGLDKKRARRGIFLVSSLFPTLTLAGISNIFKENLAFTGA
jgi:hypothetical protein